MDEKRFQIVTPGPGFKDKKTLLAKMQSGVPNLTSGWALKQEASQYKPTRERRNAGPRPKQWVLEQAGSGKQLQGSNLGSTKELGHYFALLPQADGRMVALPIDSWVGFRSKDRVKSQDEVEAQLSEQQGLRALEARLGLVTERGVKDEDDGAASDVGSDELFGSDGEADEGIARAGRRGKKGAKKRGAAAAAAGGGGEDDDEKPEDVYGGEEDDMVPNRPDQAEDWEHDEQKDDDDQEMGEKEEEDPDVYVGEEVARRKLGMEEEEKEEEKDVVGEEANKEGADKPKSRLKQMLEEKAESSDDDFEDDEEEEDDMDEEEEDDGVEYDLDKLEAHGTKRERSPAPATLRQPTPPLRQPTPPPSGGKSKPGAASEANASAKRKASTPPPDQVKKKAKAEASQAAGAGPSSTAAAAAASRNAPAGPVGCPSDEELVKMVKRGLNTVQKLAKEVKKRLVTAEHKTQFRNSVLRLFSAEQVPGATEKVLKLKAGVDGAGGPAG